jgi:hypothetical protein
MEGLRRLYADEGQLGRVAVFAQEILSAHLSPRLLEGAEVRAFVASRKKWRGITEPQLSEVVATLLSAADGWMSRSLLLAVERKHDAKDLVDAAEELYSASGVHGPAKFGLADLHVIRGARLAKEGANASAALFHFERARELDPSADVAALTRNSTSRPPP